MSKSITQVNYDELQRISKSLQNESDEITRLHSATRQKVEALRNGWTGDAANAFFREQEGQLLPAVQRVSRALGDSETVLNQIMQIIHAADEETVGYFKGINDPFQGIRLPSIDPGYHFFPYLPPINWLDGIKIDGGKVQGGKFGIENPTIKKELIEGQVYKGGFYKLGKWEGGAKFGWENKGLSAGLYGEFDAFKSEATGVIGSSAFGFTPSLTVAAGSAEGFLGFKNNNFGASVGGSLASAEVGVGLNIAGHNIRVIGGVEAGLEAGVKIGPNTRVKLGPFDLGLSFGDALTNAVN